MSDVDEVQLIEEIANWDTFVVPTTTTSKEWTVGVVKRFNCSLVDSHGNRWELSFYSGLLGQPNTLKSIPTQEGAKFLPNAKVIITFPPESQLPKICCTGFSEDGETRKIAQCHVAFRGKGSCTVVYCDGNELCPKTQYDTVEWPMTKEEQPNSLVKYFSSLLGDEELSDCVVIDHSGKRYACHRFVLYQSHVLKKMLSSHMSEGNSVEVRITDGDDESIAAMLKHLYSGELKGDDLCEECLKSLLHLADQFDLVDLKEQCGWRLFSTITVEKAPTLLVLGAVYHAKKLREKVMEFLFLNIGKVVVTDEWMQMMHKHPKLLCAALTAAYKWRAKVGM